MCPPTMLPLLWPSSIGKKLENPHYNPKLRVHREKLEDTLYDPTKEDFSHRKSFIRKPLSKKEIQENLIFMDAEFTTGQIDKTLGLVSIAIINIKGEKLLNTLTTPRQKIKSTGEKYHGITEPMMRKQRDEYEVIEEVQRLCFGKILVGHDLQLELRVLNINKKGLLGIRDLSAARTLYEMGQQPKEGGNFFKLQVLANKIGTFKFLIIITLWKIPSRLRTFIKQLSRIISTIRFGNP